MIPTVNSFARRPTCNYDGKIINPWGPLACTRHQRMGQVLRIVPLRKIAALMSPA